MDPLLKELGEKKQLFQRSVLSLTADLKDARTQMAQLEESFARETKIRQEAENELMVLKAKICELETNLDVRDEKLKSSTISPDQKDLDDLRTKLSMTQTADDTSAALCQSAQTKYLSLTKVLDEKNVVLNDYKERVKTLELQLSLLENDPQSREHSQILLRDEAKPNEMEISVPCLPSTKDNKLVRISDDIMDDVFVGLTEEVKFLSMHWKHTTKEFQSQMEKRQRNDLELENRVLKLELCLQETRAQTRKLQRMEDRRNCDLKELKDELARLQLKENPTSCGDECYNFWEGSGFRIIASMSMFILAILARR